MNELHLFAGAGGGILGSQLLGHRVVCAVENDAYARDVLVARQNDGCLPPFPIWDDVCTFDGRPWRGIIDVVSGGFPCQDISAAGKGAGITGERSGLWGEMARIIGEVRPRFAFVENSPLLVSRGLATVLGDLAEMGYACRWGVVGAHHAGAPHKRDRIWILANSDGECSRTPRTSETQKGPTVTTSATGQQSAYVADNQEYGWRPRGPGRSDSGSPRQSEQPLQTMADAKRNRYIRSKNATEYPHIENGHSKAYRQEWREITSPVEPSCEDVANTHSINRRAGTGRQDGPETGNGCSVMADAGGLHVERFIPGSTDTQDGQEPRERPAGSQDHGDRRRATESRLGRTTHGLAPWLEQNAWNEEWETGTPRVATGIPNRADRLRCIGNGQVPQAMILAWNLLYQTHTERPQR